MKQRIVKQSELQPGMVVRSVRQDGTAGAFMDHIVLQVANGQVKLARPYGCPSLLGTTCPNCLLGCEVYHVYRDSEATWLFLEQRDER